MFLIDIFCLSLGHHPEGQWYRAFTSSVHGYEEVELSSGPVDLRALSLLDALPRFLHRSVELERFLLLRSQPPLRGQCLASLSSPHLRNLRLTSTCQFLDAFRVENIWILHPLQASTFRVNPDPSALSSHLRNACPTSYVKLSSLLPIEHTTKIQHTYSVDPTKLSLMFQFYDVRAYLWSASSRGHGGGFLWRQGKRPQLLKP